MPEVRFLVRWPDASTDDCYSPSTAIKDHLEAGATYALDDFLARSRSGLNAASERVRARYGYACSSAMDQLARIESRAAAFRGEPNAVVRVERVIP